LDAPGHCEECIGQAAAAVRINLILPDETEQELGD
jgi:hypothetical protein